MIFQLKNGLLSTPIFQQQTEPGSSNIQTPDNVPLNPRDSPNAEYAGMPCPKKYILKKDEIRSKNSRPPPNPEQTDDENARQSTSFNTNSPFSIDRLIEHDIRNVATTSSAEPPQKRVRISQNFSPFPYYIPRFPIPPSADQEKRIRADCRKMQKLARTLLTINHLREISAIFRNINAVPLSPLSNLAKYVQRLSDETVRTLLDRLIIADPVHHPNLVHCVSQMIDNSFLGFQTIDQIRMILINLTLPPDLLLAATTAGRYSPITPPPSSSEGPTPPAFREEPRFARNSVITEAPPVPVEPEEPEAPPMPFEPEEVEAPPVPIEPEEVEAAPVHEEPEEPEAPPVPVEPEEVKAPPVPVEPEEVDAPPEDPPTSEPPKTPTPPPLPDEPVNLVNAPPAQLTAEAIKILNSPPPNSLSESEIKEVLQQNAAKTPAQKAKVLKDVLAQNLCKKDYDLILHFLRKRRQQSRKTPMNNRNVNLKSNPGRGQAQMSQTGRKSALRPDEVILVDSDSDDDQKKTIIQIKETCTKTREIIVGEPSNLPVAGARVIPKGKLAYHRSGEMNVLTRYFEDNQRDLFLTNTNNSESAKNPKKSDKSLVYELDRNVSFSELEMFDQPEDYVREIELVKQHAPQDFADFYRFVSGYQIRQKHNPVSFNTFLLMYNTDRMDHLLNKYIKSF